MEQFWSGDLLKGQWIEQNLNFIKGHGASKEKSGEGDKIRSFRYFLEQRCKLFCSLKFFSNAYTLFHRDNGQIRTNVEQAIEESSINFSIKWWTMSKNEKENGV